MIYRPLKNNIFTVILLFVLTCSIYAKSSMDSLLTILPSTCEAFMQQRGWPSLSIAVVHDQDIIFSQAYGYADVDKQIPATPQTIYRVGSITKVLNATMLMQLDEKGVVDLNDPLIKYIPEYTPEYPVNCGPTTLRQLVTHTAGLHVDAAQHFWHYYSNFMWIVNQGQGEITWGVPKKDLIASLNKVKIEYTPSAYPHYSNFGFQLLGIALENASGEPFESYIQTHILTPLKMQNSGFYLDDRQKKLAATGYVYLEPNFDRYVAPEWDVEILKYSGGLYSTPEDIARFISFQLRDETENNEHLLSGDGLRFMGSQQTLTSLESGDTYGIGWALFNYQGQRVVAHAGGHWGFNARAEFLPDLKLGIVVMTNCNYPQGDIGPDAILSRIIFDMFMPILQEKQSEPVYTPESVNLKDYVGLYSVPGDYANIRIYMNNDKLYFTFLEKPEFDVAILPAGYHQFGFEIDPENNPLITFKTDKSNRITSVRFLDYEFLKK